jgi:hypothetical protein
MSVPSVLVPYRGLETVIAVAKRLQELCAAEIQDVDTIGDETVIRLKIPARSFETLRSRRHGLWSSFVSENVDSRRAMTASTQRTIEDRRAWIEGSRAMALLNRQQLLSFSLDRTRSLLLAS